VAIVVILTQNLSSLNYYEYPLIKKYLLLYLVVLHEHIAIYIAKVTTVSAIFTLTLFFSPTLSNIPLPFSGSTFKQNKKTYLFFLGKYASFLFWEVNEDLHMDEV